MKFNDPGLKPGVVPDLDPRDEKGCTLPDLDGVYVEVLAEHRVWLVDCKTRHENVVKQYQDVQERIAPKRPQARISGI